jgi:hypothetical protein
MQILDQVETSDRLVLAFIMRGRHAGPYPSPLGTIPPTGQEIAVRTIDFSPSKTPRIRDHGRRPTTSAC